MSNIYTGLSGMISFENRLNVIGNNISNAKTIGYKKDIDTMKVFEESFMRIQHKNKNERIGPYQNQVHTDQIHTNFEQGNIRVTNRMLDLTLVDNPETHTINFFEVEHNNSTFLTRDGSMQVDSDGNLHTADGSFILNTFGNRINLGGAQGIVVTPEGVILNAETGDFIDQIRIRTIHQDNTSFLEKHGHNKYQVMTTEKFIEQFGPIENLIANYDANPSFQRLFNRDAIVNLQQSGQINIFELFNTGELIQGSLEESNVDLANEMTKMMIAQKGFSANAKAMMVMDQINEKDSNQLGY